MEAEFTGKGNADSTADGSVAAAPARANDAGGCALADLDWLVLEPLLRDRIAIASSRRTAEGGDAPMVGLAFWAKVSDEVHAKIEEQIKAGTFPVRLKPGEWDSGGTVWLLDVVAPSRKLASAVLASFGQIAKGAPVRVHPGIAQLVDADVLRNLKQEASDRTSTIRD